MANPKTDIDDFIKEQVARWRQQTKGEIPVITISAEPGSGGHVVAKALAARLELDLFDRDMIKKIAQSSRISDTVVETMEKERLSGIEDFIASLVDDRYLHPDVYLEHLMKVVSVIGKHGRAIIVGRGANFILPVKDRLALRVVAPLEKRIENITTTYGVTSHEAKGRAMSREAKRSAFIRKAFHADVADPVNYDLVINTQHLSVEAAVGAVIGVLVGSKNLADDTQLGRKF
jgi:cytidylate kinase